ncbi:MAG: lipopolysaccharide transport periplasmic protein LptA [Gammaproteobacteria bacterium]|nr:lipopolysaccharide transport periplasmic protein LptA [Gammaproteobacteria bacterium]
MNPVESRVLALLLLLAGCWPGLAAALSSDREQPIHIEADKLDIDESRNISTYQGNVEMQQGSLNIKSDKIVFHFNDSNEILLLEITGTPARFKQLNDEGETMNGVAGFMKYIDTESSLELYGDARLQIAEDSIESDQIIVNTETNALKAGNGSDRVRMLIQPADSNPSQ